MDFLLDEGTTEEQQRALAAALRRQQALGFLGQLTGDKVLSGLGRNLVESGGEGMRRLESGRQRGLQLRLEAKKDAATEAHRAAQLGLEREQLGLSRQRLALERRRAGEESWTEPFPGGDGKLYQQNRRTGELRPATVGGQPLAAPTKPGERGIQVPGLEVTEGANPTAEDAKKVKASLASAQRMKNYVKELRELHQKHGTEYGGAAGNRMEALTEQIRLEAKNIGELGALSGPDMGIVTRIAQADPGSVEANVKALFGVDNTQSALEGLEKWVDDTLGGNMAAYGYQPKGGAQGPVQIKGSFDLGAPPAAHPQAQAALDWLNDPANAASPKRAGVIAKLKEMGVAVP
jgi:hypothetical protein